MTENRSDAPTDLTTSKLLAYALPALPLAVLSLPLYTIVPTFYAEKLGLSLASIGLVLALVRLFDAFNDPLIGLLSDRGTRWLGSWGDLGRRRGFFAISLPITAFSALMVLWPSANAGLFYLALWSVILSLGQTATMLPYTAWGAELATDYAGRARVSAWRESVTLVGTLIAIGLPFWVGLNGPADSFHGLAATGLFVLIALPLLGSVAISRVPEPRNRSSRKITLREGLYGLFKNRAFVRLLIAYFINGLANAIPATLFLYFMADRIGRADMQGPVLFVYFLSGLAGVPLAFAAAKLFGKHKAWCLAMIVACAIFPLAGFLKVGELGPFIAITLVTGLMLGFDLSLPAAIQADVVDADTAASGTQRTGFYFSMWSLATKASLALGVGIVFPLLAWSGFEPSQAVKPDEALFALAALYAWLPPVLKALAIALMWNFPIDRVRQEALRLQIDREWAAAHH